MSEPHKHTNRLIHASSPYLLQHAHNPVEWFEWGKEAFDKAEREDKLVLVSIGYSACHWCHVMEHESFEMEDTAAIMNKHFVCIKVDREERPDVDQIYMAAVQMLTGHGGWPLNCFVLPDGRPLHGGTYYRKDDWEKMLLSLADFWWTKKEEALAFATDLTAGIKKLDVIEPPAGDGLLSFKKLSTILHAWKPNFDKEWGGHNWAPKFPMPANWELFLQFHHYSKDDQMGKAVHRTLTKMAEGGIYDQVGGGFARYSTDTFWKAPHFEKMLYDNAQLLSLYSHGWQHNGDVLYKKVVEQTHEFLIRELQSPEGGFYSALDADSEGVEGKFYIWKQKELLDILGEDEILFSLYYSVDVYGNWEHASNILYKTRTNAELEKLTGKSIKEIEVIIKRCNEKLLEVRATRVRPGLDDKIITCWNALMVKGYADAYLAFNQTEYLKAAVTCADFILTNMFADGKLHRIFKNGKVSIPAFAEDYAALCEGLISLYEASGEEKYLTRAKELIEVSITEFYDEEKKLFYFKSKNDEQLIARKLDFNDDVISSANSMFAKSLYLLGFLFSENKYHDMVDAMLLGIQAKAEKYPTGYSNWLQLLLWKQKGLYQIVITGTNADSDFAILNNHYLPGSIKLRLKAGNTIPLLADKPVKDETAIYICRDKTCGLPHTSIRAVMQQLFD